MSTLSTLKDLLAGQPVASLLEALQGQPAVGWVLKEAPSLAYVRWSGALPMGDARLSRRAHGDDTAAPLLAPGQTDADHFEPTQASILRLADLRALRQGTPSAEIHRIETQVDEEAHTALDWRAWRLVLQPKPEADTLLLVVWMDLGYAARADQVLAQAHQQIQAQQLLIAQLRGQLPEDSGLAASQASLAWAASRFADQLRREIDLSRREQRSFALMLLALGGEGFDAAAEQAATALLARQLSSGTRAMDTVAQIGPRRFGILLSGAQLTPAFARAEALRRQAAQQVATQQGAAKKLELHIGVAAYPLTADQAGALMAAAEQALAEAQGQGTGCAVLARVPLSSPPAV